MFLRDIEWVVSEISHYHQIYLIAFKFIISVQKFLVFICIRNILFQMTGCISTTAGKIVRNKNS